MDNKIGAFFTYWAEQYDADYDDCIRRAAALGFDTIGLRGTGIVKFSDAKKDATRKLADDLGIGLTFTAALAGIDISTEDPGARKQAADYIRSIVEAVAHMKGDILSGGFYASWHSVLPQGVTDKRPYMERSAACMRELCAIAADHGIRISLEILNRYETFMLNTAAEGVTYVDMVGADNLGLLLDTFHMNIEEETFAGAIETAGPLLTHFHLGEANRDVPGPDGHVPWHEIFSTLKKIGYKGVIEFEPFVTMGTEIGKNICLWRDLSGGMDLDKKMAKSLAFVKEQMASV